MKSPGPDAPMVNLTKYIENISFQFFTNSQKNRRGGIFSNLFYMVSITLISSHRKMLQEKKMTVFVANVHENSSTKY